jgi:hypothetical protein
MVEHRMLCNYYYIIIIIIVCIHWAPDVPRGSVGLRRRPDTPLATSAQAPLAPHQTPDQEESADTTFMVM